MNQDEAYQKLDQFRVPRGFRGRPAAVVQLWWLLQSLVFKRLPQFCYPVRRGLLRLFGAQVGKGVLIRPGVEITYPWKVSIGAGSWIGDHVTLYSLGPIAIGENAVISQHSYLCAADHDYSTVDFRIRERPIVVEDESWIAGGVWVGPGVRIGRGAVIGLRSVVMDDMPPAMVCAGTPCRPLKPRVSRGTGSGEPS